MRYHLQGKSGQSTVEFALTTIFLLAIIFLLLQLAMVFAFGSFVHYATFMSARAYQAASSDESDQKDRAAKVLAETVKKSVDNPRADRWPGLGRGVGEFDAGLDVKGGGIGFASDLAGGGTREEPGSSWLEGVRYKFRSPILLIPFGDTGGERDITLTSESWLLRDPSFNECETFMTTQKNAGGVVFNGEFDNGC